MSGQVSGELTDVDLSVSRSDAGNDTLGTHEKVLNISQSKEHLEARIRTIHSRLHRQTLQLMKIRQH